MIVFKENGNVFMAIRVLDNEFDVKGAIEEAEENIPMFGLSDGKTVIGFDTMNITVADAVRYGNIEAPENLDEKSLFVNLIPQIKEALSDYGYGKTPLSTTATVVMRGERAFACLGETIVYELGEYLSLCANDQLEFALLDRTRELKGEERIREIYRMKEECLGKRQFPIVYMDTKTGQLHIVNDERRG